MNSQNQKGNTLIEVLAVIAILSCATAGIYAGISNIYGRFHMTKSVLETKDSIKAMRDYFSSAPPETISTEQLVNIGVFKDYYASDKKYSVNFLGTKMEIKRSGNQAGQYNDCGFAASGDPTFRLYFYDVFSKECIDLLMSDWGNDASSGLVEIGVGKGSEPFSMLFRWRKDHGNGSYYELPPELGNVTTACLSKGSGGEGEGEGESDTVTIYWEYFF